MSLTIPIIFIFVSFFSPLIIFIQHPLLFFLCGRLLRILFLLLYLLRLPIFLRLIILLLLIVVLPSSFPHHIPHYTFLYHSSPSRFPFYFSSPRKWSNWQVVRPSAVFGVAELPAKTMGGARTTFHGACLLISEPFCFVKHLPCPKPGHELVLAGRPQGADIIQWIPPGRFLKIILSWSREAPRCTHLSLRNFGHTLFHTSFVFFAPGRAPAGRRYNPMSPTGPIFENHVFVISTARERNARTRNPHQI